MDFLLKSEIQSSLKRTRELLASGILCETPGPLFKRSVLIEVLINMKDLLIKSEKHLGKRVDFTDDVNEDDKLKIKDVTDLIANFRDASCHNDSFRRNFGGCVSSFNEMSGKGVILKVGDLEIGSKYQDDLMFNMGNNILYLKRHIERAFNELEDNFKPYLV